MPRWMNDVTLHASGLTEAERHELWGLLAAQVAHLLVG